MAEQKLSIYKSRRNRVCLTQTDAGRFVVKTFLDESCFQKELQIYKLLQNKDIPCAQVMAAEGKTLVLSELPGQTLVECLQQQEQTGVPVCDIWKKLVAWLTAFHQETGFVMMDVNLRNFLYDEKTKMLYGLDFEECSPDSIIISAASVAAFIRTYQPENTPLKQEISKYVLQLFAQNYEMEVDRLFLESAGQEEKILARRKNKI
ncbi:MAG: hypothetical protein IJB47_00590 [Oscillospiraceae bacterium]|nr:hypothetical protein [Oscillospiraceae bacterium]